MINIAGVVPIVDPNYRYQMPKLVVKAEGRGKGKKTVIVNMVEIAEALHISPAYPMKFFGIELGAQSQFIRKTGRAIVTGHRSAPDLQKILEKLIDSYILCPTCGSPELTHSFYIDDIERDCPACGYNGYLNWSHKLVTFILKENERTKRGGKTAIKKKKKKNKDPRDGKRAPKKKKKKKDPTDKKQEEDFGFQKKTALGVLQEFLERDRTVDQILDELRRLQIARSLDTHQQAKILLEALIDTSKPKEVPAQYTKHAKTLKGFADNEQKSEMLIYCIEEQVGLLPKLVSRIPIILKNLYDAQVLEEEYITKWFDGGPEASAWLWTKEKVAPQVRLKASPFVDWLKDAEEEGDEEDDEDD